MVRIRKNTRKTFALLAIAALLVMTSFPFVGGSFAEVVGEPVAISIERLLVDKPYEKVIASNGPWYTERLNLGATNQLVIGYEGSYAIDGGVLANFNETTFKLSEDLVLTGAYFPYTNSVSGNLTFSLVNTSNVSFGPFSLTPEPVARINEADMALTLGSQQPIGEILYTYVSDNPLTLAKGTYRLVLSDANWQVRTRQTGPEGAYLLKGIFDEAYQTYKQETSELRISVDGPLITLGNEFDEDSQGEPEPLQMNPAYFELEEAMIIDEIVINTFNYGEGVPPGLVGIMTPIGEPLYVEQAKGYALEGLENGLWAIEPDIILPPGVYEIVLNDPRIFTYDAYGDPMFYVNAAPVGPGRFNFTGTYRVDLATYKAMTLMGAVQKGVPSFAVKDFELTVLDKGETLELIGMYEGMPFSINVPIIEADANYVIGTYQFGADIPNLQAKTTIGAQGTVKLMALNEGDYQIIIDGIATYERAETADKGGDSNTYSVESKGKRTAETLPPFVVKALGAAGFIAAGTIPGPDTPLEMATGLLFPPLVGVIVHVLSDILKKKEIEEAARKAAEDKKNKILREPKKPTSKHKKYTKAWYKDMHPGASDETIAMLMLADAMGNTDEPDDDPFSIGDNEKDTGGRKGSQDGSGDDSLDYEEDHDADADVDGDSDSEVETDPELPENQPKELTERDFMSEEQKAEADVLAKEETAAEEAYQKELKEWQDSQKPPKESMTLATGLDGRTSTYELDPETGEWVNPETGGVFNQSQYEELQRNLPGNQEWQDTERQRIANRDTEQDRQLTKMLQDEKEKAYLERVLKKYNVNTKEEADKLIQKQMALDEASSAKWQQIGNVARGMELAATGVGMAADEAVDFLASKTGFTGKVISAGYKITKSLASEVADKGYEKSNLKSAFVSGAFDGAKEFTGNSTVKNALTIGGETFSRYIGAKPGEEWNAIADGLSTSASSILQGSITDYIGGEGFGDLHVVNVKGNRAYVALKTDGKWLGNVVQASTAKRIFDNKSAAQMVKSGVNVASSALKDAVVKPYITDPASKMVQGLPGK